MKRSVISEWHHWGRWPGTVLYHSLWLEHNTTRVVQANPFLGVREYRVLDYHYYFLKEDLERICADARSKFEKDTAWFDQYFRRCDAETARIAALPDDASLEEFFATAVETLACSFGIELLDYATERYVNDTAEKDARAVLSAMVPKRKTLLMEFKEKAQSGAQGLLPEYEWVGTHGFAGEPMTEKGLVSWRSGAVHGEEASAEVKGYDTVVDVGSKLAFYRSYIVETVDMVSYRKWSSIRKLGEKHGLGWKETIALRYDELVTLEKKGVVPDDIHERSVFGFSVTGGTYTFFTGESVRRELAHMQTAANTDVTELKGRTAYAGKVKGVVKVLHHSSEMDKVKEGDILVAAETQPDFIVALGRAAAFVTNHGGITSHAALIAREMRKPCVIGTGNATEVFKDGDMVEVDADAGVVRKIGA